MAGPVIVIALYNSFSRELTMPELSSREVNSVRGLLAYDEAGASDRRVQSIVAETISSLPSDTAEDVFGALKSVAKVALPVIEKAGAGALQGAATGGPYGALLGAGAGLASGAVQQAKGTLSTAAPGATSAPAPKGSSPVLSGTPQLQPQAASQPAASLELPTGQAAAAIILGLLQNTLIQQALLSQVLGEKGRSTLVTPSGAVLPRASINQLLSQLLMNAAETLPESGSSDDQSYLKDDSGQYMVDPASPEQQAAMVLAHVNSGKALRTSGRDVGGDFDESWQDVEWLPAKLGNGRRNRKEL